MMGNRKYFLFVVCFCLLQSTLSLPLADSNVNDEFCSGDDFLRYENGKEYSYEYSTQTDLWINDVSEESRSKVELKARVFVRSVRPCLYLLRLEDASLTGESIDANNVQSVLQNLNDFSVQFRLNSKGELDQNVDFSEGDSAWSRNIKRGILSVLQVKSTKALRDLDQSNESNSEAKSAVVYETDVLGRCRTTYVSNADSSITKKKSLHRCTLNENSKTSAIQYVPYKSIPEFYQARLFVETYNCEIQVKNSIVYHVSCDEHSTYKVGSRGDKGAQAVVRQSLRYLSTSNGYDRRAQGPFETHNIRFEYTDKSLDDMEFKNFAIDTYLNDLCSRVNDGQGLENEHSNNFRALVNSVESKSNDQLYNLYKSSKAKCSLAGLTVSQSLVYANSENAFETVLRLLDENAFDDQRLINEYPVLTALARLQEPGLNFLIRLQTYLQSKTTDFAYLNKLYLVYSSLVKSYCDKNQCDQRLLDNFSSLFANNLGTNCADSSKKQLVTASLKAIGNIGYLSNVNTLTQCALNSENNLETRVSAIQSFRRFDPNTIINAQGLIDLLKNTNEDTELRINAFQILVKCIDTERFQQFARSSLSDLLLKENDIQFFTYVVDYAREHGLTILLNPIMSNPELKERFSVNFKELSWNNFKYRYSLGRDGALELDTSVIYVSDRSFIPRSIRLNATLHMFGMSVNFADITLRTEGLEDVLKAVIIDKLSSEQLLKHLMSQPEQIIDIVQTIADKLKYTKDKPFMSVLIRVYGSDVFYSELDSISKLKRLSDFVRNPREYLLYSQVNTIKNMFLIDSRVRQPLMNGFEFNTFMDTTFGLLLIKKSSKSDSNEVRNFKIDNFYSASLAVNRRFEVQINKENKLALKKKAFMNARLRLDINGEKKSDSVVYNWNLTPLREIPLFVFDGKFYKLSNGQYNEVTQFNVDRRTYQNCTSSNFHNGLGIDLCLSIDRPRQGSLWEALRPVDFDRVLNNFNDQDDENDDEEDEEQVIYGNANRPKLILSGPYHYEVTLKNPDNIRTLTVSGNRVKTENSKTINAVLQTTSDSNQIIKRMQFSYSRSRKDTNRGIERHFNVELRNVQRNDIRFKLSGDVVYSKQETLSAKLELQNKILRELDLNLEVTREKKEENVVPSYKVELLLDSKLRQQQKYRKFSFSLTPQGRDISSNLIIEKLNEATNFELEKIAEAALNLKSRSGSKYDYDVDFKMETRRPSSLTVSGVFSFDIFKSNVDLSVLYAGPQLRLETPANVRFSHALDLSPTGKSFAQIGVKYDPRNIDHNVKILFKADPTELRLDHLEIQVQTPRNKNSLPYTVFFSKEMNDKQPNSRSLHIKIGIDNFAIDLSTRESKLAKSLIKLDSNSLIKSLTLDYVRNSDGNSNNRNLRISLSKNEVQFANIESTLNGCLDSIRSNANEVSRQTLSSSLRINVFENSAGVNTKLDLESSIQNRRHYFNFDLKTEGLLRILIKVISIEAKLDVNRESIDAQYEIKKIGEVRSFAVKTKPNSQIRQTSGGYKEFDVDYLKVLGGNRQLKSSGTVRYKFENLKNFESSLNLPGNFRYELVFKNERRQNDKLFGVHNIRLNYAHLDVQQAERELKIFIDGETQSNGIIFNILAKKGQPNALDSVENLDYILDLDTKNTFWYFDNKRRMDNGQNSLILKSKKFGFDINAKCSGSTNKRLNNFDLDASLFAKFPALISDPGSSNFLKHSLSISKSLDGNSKSISGSLESDNKFINRAFKSLNVDYSRKPLNIDTTSLIAKISLVNANDQTKFINLDVQRQNCVNNGLDEADESQEDDDSLEIFPQTSQKHRHLCSGTKLNLKQNLLTNVNSRIVQGKTFDTTDCTLETKLIRKKQTKPSYNYLLDVLLSAECKDLVFLKESLTVKREADKTRDGMKSTDLVLHIQSDIYFQSRHVEIKHKKFYSKSGSLEIEWDRDSTRLFAGKFFYTRELEKSTSKLSRANYVLNANFGSETYKNCELNIESRQFYYNKLECRIKSNKLPVELKYGYSIKADGVKDLPDGKRDIELTINLPTTRQLRVEYQSSRAFVTEEQFDDDDDFNNEREFSSNIKYFWDYGKDRSKMLNLALKRDNYGKTNSKFSAEVSSSSFKSLKLIVDRKRLFNQTDIDASLSYVLQNNVQNELQVFTQLASDFDSSQFSIELNLARPSFNIMYENKFNKLNGRLKYLSIRLARLLKFSVDKEYDPDNRQISLELVSPNENKFSVEYEKNLNSANVYMVKSVLKQKSNGQVLSVLESNFDSNNNVFDVNVLAKQSQQEYNLNVGIYNESLANAAIRHVTNNNQLLGVGSLQIVNINDPSITVENDNRYLQLSLKWNRLWNRIYNDILASQVDSSRASQNEQFNSYFGDVYATFVNDLKETYEKIKSDRKQVRNELKQLVLMIADFYTNFLPNQIKNKLVNKFRDIQEQSAQEEKVFDQLPLYKRVFARYNNLAQTLNRLHFKVRSYSKTLSRFIPRLTMISYNKENQLNRMARQFDNNLVAHRPLYNARNLYQFNAEYRDTLRRLGNRILSVKSNLLRNIQGANIRSLINKYKPRSLNDYTIAGHVFNRRNLVTFDGESKLLKSRCKFLLAHELTRNQFSVILNSYTDKSWLSVSAYGQPSIDITPQSASINSRPLALPHTVELKDKNAKIVVKRSFNSVSVEVNKDLLVTCYEDSKSCSVALTRWYTGKVNGLFGKSNLNSQNEQEDYWFLDNSCRYPNFQMRKPSDEAVKTCYSIFGKHRKATFRNAIQAINVVGWQKLCELAVNADSNNKCTVMKAFAHHARLHSIEVNEPNECYSCKAKGKSFLINEKLSGNNHNLFENGNDYVFVLLPCDKSKYSVDLSTSARKLLAKQPNNRYYFVKVLGNNGASVYQSEYGQTYNFDVKRAYQTIADDQTSQIEKDDLYNALFLAGSLFTERLAQNRHLIIVGCGNCVKYSSRAAILIERLLSKRNIVVSSWDEYNIADPDLFGDNIIGYGQNNVFLTQQGSNQVEVEPSESYRIEHRLDLCTRLATKTNGNVFNINFIRKPEIFEQIAQRLSKSASEHTSHIKTCERVETPFGDVDDFSFKV